MSLSKIFFNSPRYNGKAVEANGNNPPTGGATNNVNTNQNNNTSQSEMMQMMMQQQQQQGKLSNQKHFNSSGMGQPQNMVAASTDFTGTNLL